MNNDWLELEGKTVIVTGAASGIGKEVAQEFLNIGANVVFLIWQRMHQRWMQKKASYYM